MTKMNDRPPELSEEQMRELLMLGRSVLRGQTIKLFRDQEDRLCYKEVEEGDTTRVE